MPEPLRVFGARALHNVIRGREYLLTLQVPLWFLLPADERPKDLSSLTNIQVWLPRVTEELLDAWAEKMDRRYTAQLWGFERDKARLALETSPPEEHAHVDWTTWTLDHPAYRRAVPQSRSFLREAFFDDRLSAGISKMPHSMRLSGFSEKRRIPCW